MKMYVQQFLKAWWSRPGTDEKCTFIYVKYLVFFPLLNFSCELNIGKKIADFDTGFESVDRKGGKSSSEKSNFL